MLMADPETILLDEPAGGVNPALIDRIASLVRELNAEGRTFLIVEHNMELVMSLSRPRRRLRPRPADRRGPAVGRPTTPRVLEAYLGV